MPDDISSPHGARPVPRPLLPLRRERRGAAGAPPPAAPPPPPPGQSPPRGGRGGGRVGEPADGAAIVLHVEGPSEGEAFVAADPYGTEGLVTAWRVEPWTVVT